MAEDLNEITIGENVLRLEKLKLPNGNTYILGCSFEEAQEIYNVLSDNIEAVNDDVELLKTTVESNERVTSAALNDLKIENQNLKNEIAELKELIQRRYMAYYDVDESTGIDENNIYTR